jgi:hypothetical protein
MLSDTACRTIKPTDKDQKLFDGAGHQIKKTNGYQLEFFYCLSPALLALQGKPSAVQIHTR